MPHWTIEGCGNNRFSCLSKTIAAAKRAAQRLGKPVKIVYHGPRPRVVTGIQHAHFRVTPQGQYDLSVDPLYRPIGRRKR